MIDEWMILQDPSLLIPGECPNDGSKMEVRQTTDEYDTYIWFECETCGLQEGITH